MNNFFPYMFLCPLQDSSKIPISVSIVIGEPCEIAENNLKLISNHNQVTKKKFGVCTKQHSFGERHFGIKFLEWIHLLKILGAEKVHGYHGYVHHDVEILLDYLDYKNLIEFKEFLEPFDVDPVKQDKRTYEINLLNDCFYRTQDLYEYIVLVDPDEVIMPMMDTDRSWQDVIQHFDGVDDRPDVYLARSRIYADYPLKELNPEYMSEIPSYYYILQHLQVLLKIKKSIEKIIL